MQRVSDGEDKKRRGDFRKLRSTHTQAFKPRLTLQILFKIGGHR